MASILAPAAKPVAAGASYLILSIAFESKADIVRLLRDIRFAPTSRHCAVLLDCPVRAIRGHSKKLCAIIPRQ